MKHTKRRIGIIATSVAAVLIGGGVAVAYWTSSGTGSGSAPVGTTTALTISTATTTDNSVTPAVAHPLYPGASTPIYFTVTNSDASAVNLTDVAVTVASVTQTQPSTVGTCQPGDFTVNHNPPAALVTVAGGATVTQSAFGSYALVMTNTGVSQDACKGATVVLATTAS